MRTLRSVQMLRVSIFTWNFVHYFYEPLEFCRVFSSRHIAPGGALDDEEFFVVEGSGEWRGRRESDRFRRIPQVQFLDKVEICALLRRQVQFSSWSGRLLTCPYMCNDRCLALVAFPHFLRECGLRS